MKALICHDEYGHFHIVNIRNRKKIWELLTEVIDGGDYWANRDYDDRYHIDENNYLIISNGLWLGFLESFQQRGTMELVDIEEDPIQKQLLDSLSMAIHWGTNLPRGDVYDEAMKPIVDFYWKAKEYISKEDK